MYHPLAYVRGRQIILNRLILYAESAPLTDFNQNSLLKDPHMTARGIFEKICYS